MYFEKGKKNKWLDPVQKLEIQERDHIRQEYYARLEREKNVEVEKKKSVKLKRKKAKE